MFAASGGGNFLIPNGTFIIELIIFILVLGTIAKFILPPIQKAMNDRETTIRSALSASDEGQAEANRLVVERRKALQEAREQARTIMDAASTEVNEMIDAARAQAQIEHDRLVSEAQVRIDQDRDRLREESLAKLGDLVVSAASQVIGGSIDSSKHRQLIADVVSAGRNGSGE